MKVVILCLSVLYLGHAGAQRPDLFWVGGFEEYPNVPGYANYSIRFGNFGAISIDTLDWGIPFESTTAAISDEAGHLVLATNGCVIIDGAGQTIAGGASINPGPLHDQVCNITGYTAPKGAMFLPMPGHPDTYYLLHEAAQYDPHNGLISALLLLQPTPKRGRRRKWSVVFGQQNRIHRFQERHKNTA